MPKSGAEVKAQVMAELEAAVDKALAQAKKGDGLTITGIEEIVLEIRSEVGQQLTGLLVAQGSEQSVPGPRCATCEQEMHYKGKKRRYVRTRTGEVQVERAHYYCPGCQQGHFPPG